MKQRAEEKLEDMELAVETSLNQIGSRLTEALLNGDVEKLARLERAFQEHWGYRDGVREALNCSPSVAD